MSDRFLPSLRYKIAAGLLTAVLVLVVGAISFWAVSRSTRASAAVDRTATVLLEQQQLLGGLADAETATRGYAITGDATFLGPFTAARTTVPRSVARLRTLTADNPRQQLRLDTLESVARQRLELSDQIMRLRRTQGFEMARALIATGQGKMVMDHARALAASMESEERRLLARRTGALRDSQRLAYFVIGIGSVLAFLLSALINRSIRRDVIERERQQKLIEQQSAQLRTQSKKLVAQQTELEQRLSEQEILTRELGDTNDNLRVANIATGEERVRAELALANVQEAQREQIRLARQNAALLDSTEAGFYGMDAEGRCTFINRAGADMLGYTPDELIGRNVHDSVHHHHADGSNYPIEECPIYIASRSGTGARREDEVFWRRDGTAMPVEYSTSPIFDDEELKGAVVAFADITVRRRTERIIVESEGRKAAVLRSTLDSIITIDGNGIVLEFNRAAQETFGYTYAEAVGASLGDLIVPDRYREAHRAGMGRYLKTGEIHVLGKRLELPAMRRDGSEFDSELTITRSDIDGDAAFIGVLRDITARKKAESEREQLIAALARSNQELDQFAYVASHDLKAPLRGIANLSQWIEEDMGKAFAGETKGQMEMLRGRVHRMEALIDGILQYSRAGRIRAKPETTDTGAMIAEAIEFISPPADVSFDVMAEMPVIVTERIPLQQVFLNLIGNAITHAGRRDPLIAVRWADAGPLVVLRIR